MAIANDGLLRTEDLKITDIKGHNSHEEARIVGTVGSKISAPIYFAFLPRGVPIPPSGPSLPSNGRATLLYGRAGSIVNDISNQKPSRN